MSVPIYVSLSGQVALERRLNTIANNVANMNTVGFRGDAITFEAALSGSAFDPVTYATSGETFIDRSAGAMVETGNALDVAVDGEGWFAISTPRGVVYTRDGRFTIDDSGQLRTVAGHTVLDPGLQPLRIDPTLGPPAIARNGLITQDGDPAGAIGLFRIDPAAKLKRYGNSGVIPDRAATAIVDSPTDSIHQGYVEQANIQPILEMTRLITVQRAFEAAASAVETSESAERKTIRDLGASS